MNVHINTSIAARNEISQISASANFFISHASSAPVIGQHDDSIIGSFLVTRKDVRLDKYHAMLLFSHASRLPDFSDYDDKTKYTGWQIASKLLEETPINYKRGTSYYNESYANLIDYDPDEITTEIVNGKLVKGILDKKAIGKGSMGGVFHIIHNEYGADKALEVMHNLQQVAINFAYQCGFTVGIMDLLLNQKSIDRIHEIEGAVLNDSQLITDKLNNSELIPPIGKTTREFYEEQQIATLRIMDDFVEPIFDSLDKENNGLFQLIISGSKGKINHIFHMVSAIGQELINGERIREKFSTRRTMPYFRRFETNADARGYVPDSYISGISMWSFIASAESARFGLISKALSTSITGEQNRKSIKNLETIIINNSRFCTKNNNIIQFSYGEDNLDPRFVEKVKFPTIMISDEDFTAKYKNPDNNKIFEEEFAQLQMDRAEYRRIFLNFEAINLTHLIDDVRFMPVDVSRVIKDALYNFGSKTATVDVAEILEMTNIVREWLSNLPYVMLNEDQERAKAKIPDFIIYTTYLMGILIRSYLCSMELKRMNKKILQIILDKIKTKYQMCLTDYGTAVGILAAQSFSEPLTQYMLDAHHRAVSGGTSKGEMQRAKEVLGARTTENMLAPEMFIAVDESIRYDKNRVQEIANAIEVMDLKQFVVLWQVFFEKFAEPTHPKYVSDIDFIQQFIKFNPLITPPSDLLKWCIRIVLNKTTMILKNMSIELIVSRLRDLFPNIYIVYTPENSKKVILRIYIRNAEFKGTVEAAHILEKGRAIIATIIRGVEGIHRTEVVKMIRNKVDNGGKIVRDVDRYGIKTLGTNIYGVLKNKYVDKNLVQTDSLWETFEMFGIEAARQRIISEMRRIGEGNINHRHYTIYADDMTMLGKISSIERGGLASREQSNIFLRLGFSAPIATLEECALNTMTDDVVGITGKLLVGSTPAIGTFYNSFYVNSDVIKKNIKSADTFLDDL